jgi:hypothetical protein
MQVKFYRALPEHLGPAVQPPDSDESGNPLLTVVCLERSDDPDANNHTGYDYWGVYEEDGEHIEAWEGKNVDVLEPIEYSELPDPVTFYPEPFASVTGGDSNTMYYVRARDESGRFIADDPATPDVNEAWVAVNEQ